jgi:hypothetical protein
MLCLNEFHVSLRLNILSLCYVSHEEMDTQPKRDPSRFTQQKRKGTPGRHLAQHTTRSALENRLVYSSLERQNMMQKN